MTFNSSRIFQGFKYAIFALLTLNIYWYFIEEFAASKLQVHCGIAPTQLIEVFAATIDTLAWVVLLLTFELQTSGLPNHFITNSVAQKLQTARVISYVFIVYAFYGYVQKLIGFSEVGLLADVNDLCRLVDHWSYSINLDEYVAITHANCRSFSPASAFYQLPGMFAVIDAKGLAASRALAVVDVINAAAWLLIVLVLEIDVRLKKRDRFAGVALKISNVMKIFLYPVLLVAAVFWGVYGDILDCWDAFLWLMAFCFIELKVMEQRPQKGPSATERKI